MATIGDAYTNQQGKGKGKGKKKEPEWNDLCKDVFDQYLGAEDPFSFSDKPYDRNTSQDSTLLFGSSNPSDQSIRTTDTSPVLHDMTTMSTPSRSRAPVQRNLREAEAMQPQVQPPPQFWDRTLKTLERTAIEKEQTTNRLRAVKSHNDFLSLGGFSSPPMPSPTTFPPLSIPRQRSWVAGSAPNGKRVVSNRSVSRARSSAGVSKQSTTVHPIATMRKRSISPVKAMGQSRRRSGFHDTGTGYVTSDATSAWPSKWPLSSRSSGYGLQDGYAIAGAYPVPNPAQLSQEYLAYDEPISPLTQTFQHAHIHTGHDLYLPPSITSVPTHDFASFPFNHQVDATADIRQQHTVPPMNEAQMQKVRPAFPGRDSSLVPEKIQSFDFGFNDSPEFDFWDGSLGNDALVAEYATMSFSTTPSIPQSFQYSSTPLNSLPDSFLDTGSVSAYGTSATAYEVPPPRPNEFNIDARHASHDLIPRHDAISTMSNPPITPSRRQSESPPLLATDPRSRRANRSQSRTRTTSRHRRAKSIHAAPRTVQSPEKGGFVNYTPQDSGKLLSGVAPSGSSKTKARREKEAADRRRILSQAAVKAVVEAGGDLNALSAAGLLI